MAGTTTPFLALLEIMLSRFSPRSPSPRHAHFKHYRYATAAKIAANKIPSALCLFLLNLPSDSLVDAAAPAPFSPTFDTETVVGVTPPDPPCILVTASVAVAAAPEKSPPKLLAAALASEYKLPATDVASENTLPTAEVAWSYTLSMRPVAEAKMEAIAEVAAA